MYKVQIESKNWGEKIKWKKDNHYNINLMTVDQMKSDNEKNQIEEDSEL